MLISSDVQFLIKVPFGGRATARKELQNLRYTRANDHNLHNNIYTHCTFSRLFSIRSGEILSHILAHSITRSTPRSLCQCGHPRRGRMHAAECKNQRYCPSGKRAATCLYKFTSFWHDSCNRRYRSSRRFESATKRADRCAGPVMFKLGGVARRRRHEPAFPSGGTRAFRLPVEAHELRTGLQDCPLDDAYGLGLDQALVPGAEPATRLRAPRVRGGRSALESLHALPTSRRACRETSH
jgi:hypothetical protein